MFGVDADVPVGGYARSELHVSLDIILAMCAGFITALIEISSTALRSLQQLAETGRANTIGLLVAPASRPSSPI